MNVRAQPLSAAALEDSADRIRRQISATVDRLRFNLAPKNLANEITERTGIADLSLQEIAVSATKRRPRTTILVVLGVGIWALSAMRSRGTGTIGSSVGALAQSGRTAVQRRAAAKREEFMRLAQTHVSTGAERLLDAVETATSGQVSRLSLANAAGAVIDSAVRMLLFAALEAMVAKGPKGV